MVSCEEMQQEIEIVNIKSTIAMGLFVSIVLKQQTLSLKGICHREADSIRRRLRTRFLFLYKD